MRSSHAPLLLQPAPLLASGCSPRQPANFKEPAPQRPEELAARVSTVFVSAPPSLTYGQMPRVVDALKAAGGDPIGLPEHSAPR